MTAERLLELLGRVAAGQETPEALLSQLSWLPVEAVDDGSVDGAPWARLDHHRSVRLGFPEVVLCQGKTAGQVVEICARLAERGGFLATRAEESVRRALVAAFPDASVNELGRTVHLGLEPTADDERGTVLVVTAGTADVPVAEEAAVTASVLGNPVEKLYDVGVAGLHRLLRESEALRRAGVIIAVAGMDGALPSVIGGLVGVPVIAVPTSAGYGAAFGGVAAMLTMLNSCASGVTVVNIDNGFGAACAATRINRLAVRR